MKDVRKTCFAILLAITGHFAIAQRPNIVFIIGDDISADDIGCFGNKFVSTPNIDKLAQNGMKFNNAYLTISSCSPSRASIITGRYPHNTGGAELHTAYADNQIVFPKLLKEAGYYNAQAGKWHFGKLGNPAGICLPAFDKVDDNDDQQLFPSGGEKWVDRLKERPKDKPFFMWFAAHDAHLGWDDKIVTKKYNPNEIEVPGFLLDDAVTRKELVSYFNEITRLDYYVGEVMKELAVQGILENTIFVFMADNGRPFSGYKTQLRTGGIKTPLIISWPGHIKPNTVSNSLISSIDIAPTLLEACNVQPAKAMQGKSFVSLFQNPESVFRNYVFAEHNWHDFEAYERMICNGRYLYIENGLPHLTNIGATDLISSTGGGAVKKMGKGPFNSLTEQFAKGTLDPVRATILTTPQPTKMLYDLESDPHCYKNIIADKNQKAVSEKMATQLKIWKKQTGDYQPKNLTKDWYSRTQCTALPYNGNRGEMPGTRTGAIKITHPGPF